MGTGTIEISEDFTNCSNATDIGFKRVLTVTWDRDHVVYGNTDPLRCVDDTDIDNFELEVDQLPATHVIGVRAQGNNYTSTATVVGDSVTFTLPLNVDEKESWTVYVEPAPQSKGEGSTTLHMKLLRTEPP